MLNAIFRPIVAWPGKATPPAKRKAARFRASYQKTLSDLEAELLKVQAANVVIQVDLKREDIRNDGWPRSTARAPSPRVVLSFTKAGQQTVSMPCDCFKTWEQNLRAISLTLKALRMINQYGVTQHDEQYSGFARLAPPEYTDDYNEALRYIAVKAGIRNEDVRMHIDGAYRLAAKRCHPEAPGGSHEDFVLLQQHYNHLKNTHR